MPSQDEISQLFALIRELTKDINGLRVDLAKIQTADEVRRTCPDPGACVGLRVSFAETEKRIAKLETTKTQLMSSKATLFVLGSSLVSLATLVLLAVQTFHK